MKEKRIVRQCDNNSVNLKLKGFNVYEMQPTPYRAPSYNRRDFFKVCMFTSKSLINYADRSILVDGTTLFFANPHIPYSVELLSERQSGYACLFTEDFVKANDRNDSLQESPLFKIGGNPVFELSED